MKTLWLILFLTTQAWASYSPGVFVADPNTPTNRAKVTSSTPAGTDEALACILHPNSAALAVTQSGSWAQNIADFGGNVVVTGTGISGLGIPRVTVSSDSSIGIDQTTPGTTNRVQANLDKISGVTLAIGQHAMANSIPVAIASDQTAPKTYLNSTAAFSQVSTTTAGSSVGMLSGTVEIMIQADNTNTDCVRWQLGAGPATSTSGMVLQAGQDTGKIDSGAALTVASCSGTQKLNITMIAP